MLLRLLNKLMDINLRHQERRVLRDLTLIYITVTVHCCSTISSLLFFSFDKELTVRVSLYIVDCDIDWDHVFDFLDDRSDIVNYNVSVLIALQQKQLSSLLVVMGIDCGNRHLFLDAHVIQLSHQLLVVRMWLKGWRWSHHPDAKSSNRV